MHLFLSDLHLGRDPNVTSHEAETDALDLLRSYEQDLAQGGALFLVGDVFHAYIEYKHLVPKSGIRFVGMLGELAEAGIPVTYLIGNRDPWHIDFFESELGIRVARGPLETELAGRRTYISHGDFELSDGPISGRLRAFVRHPVVSRLYRNVFPGDAALGFAKWFSQTFGTDGKTDSGDDEKLARIALERLNTSDYNLVVHGHSHCAQLSKQSSGTYVNPGYWFADRTFATLGEFGPALYRWSGGQAIPL